MSKPSANSVIGKLLLGAIVLFIGFAVVVVWLFSGSSSDATTPSQAVELSPFVANTQTIEIPVSIATALEEVEPPINDAAPATSRTSVSDVQATEPDAPVNKWTNIMARAGIAEADQPMVDALVFTGFDWNLAGCGCAQLMRASSNPVTRFHLLNQYVRANYSTWTAAQAQAAQGSW